jgi:hypothetical protein
MVQFQSPAAQFDAVIANVGALTQKEIVTEAKRLHGDVMRTPPKPVGFKRHVDGREAPEEAVKIGGVIVYDYNRLDFIGKLAIEILREMSPVGGGKDPHPGLYRDSHQMFINGQAVSDLKGLQPGQELSIANTVAYSQIIEVGTRGSIKLRINKGGHVYERAARKLRSNPEVANAAKIEFTFRDVFGRFQVNQMLSESRGRRGVGVRAASGGIQRQFGRGGHNKSEVRWPTLIITAL